MISSVTRALFRLGLLCSLLALGLAVGRYAKRPRPATRLATSAPTNRLRPPPTTATTAATGTTSGSPTGTALPSTTGLAAPRPAAPLLPRPPRGKLIALLYGGNRHGEVEPCG